ncbi:two-component regulator propeller domain-containing protein [Dyadobacter sp. 676]|uniref:histidine kinase n=1 Tax=Dyadobacter sp. 676 TaxID=3088362 RepID=A0AAU8FHK7_9BACT
MSSALSDCRSMPQFFRIVFTFVFLISVSSHISGAGFEGDLPSNFNITHFTDENGLPQNSVKAITKDNRGNFWLATERGLVRYDGNNFVVFDDFGSSFPNRNIASFHIAPLNAKDDFFAINDDGTFIRITSGRAMIEPSFYRGQLKAQPFGMHGQDGYLTEGLPSIRLMHVSPDHYIIPLGFDRYYVYDNIRLTYYSSKRRVNSVPIEDKGFWGFFRLDQDLYHMDENGLLNFRLKDGLIQKSIVRLTGDLAGNVSRRSGKKHKLFWSNASNQVFLLVGNNLYSLQRQQNGDLRSRLVLDGFDFTGNFIVSIYLHPLTGRLLLGSQLKGLFVIDKKPFHALTTTAMGTDNNFYAQVPYSDSTVLSSQGLEFGLTAGEKNTYVRQMLKITRHIGWDKYSVLMDHTGHIWARNSQTLFKFDHEGKRLLAKWVLPTAITQLYQGKDERIWIGTKLSGLYFIDPQKPSAAPEYFSLNTADNISWIQHQNADTLWIGSEKGLYRLSIHSKKLISVKELDGIYIRSLYIPADGKQIWITTYKDGVFLFENGRLTRFPRDKKNYLASAHCIIEDKNGFFWIPTNKGLFQISKNDLLQYARKPFDIYYHHHIKTAGFNTNEFNGGCQPCAVRLANGYVSLPSINGLVWFLPEDIRPELPMGNIYLEGVSVKNKPWKFSANKLHLDADASEVSLKINVAYLGNPDNLKLAYRLGKDGDPLTGWREINPKDPGILLPHLASGEYRLTIRKVNGFGPRNYQYKRIEISVAKKWYETWWFRLATIAVLTAAFGLILRLRTRSIESQKQALEARVDERTRDLELVLKALGKSEKQLELQLRLHVHMIASISHDIRTPVKYMGAALQFVQRRIEKNQTDEAVSAIHTMTRTITQLDQLISNIVTYIKPEVHRHYSDLKSVNLHELVSERMLIFKEIFEMNGGSFQIAIRSQEQVSSDRELLGVVLHNLIDNALKAKPDGAITVSTFDQNGDLHLVVTDQGPGLPAALLHWLNNTGQTETSSLPEQYNGLGFPMIKEISKLLGIRVFAENKTGAHIHLIFSKPAT